MSDLASIKVGKLKKAYRLSNFVETGIYNAEGLAEALEKGFDQCYSCDIIERIVKLAKKKFAAHKNVHLFAMDSFSFLEKIIPDLSGPTLFWLDAHFPERYSKKKKKFSPELFYPTLSELRIVAKKKDIQNDVILCDDMRLLSDKKNPTFSLWSKLKKHYPSYMTIKDVSIQDFREVLDETHICRLVEKETGYLIFTPK